MGGSTKDENVDAALRDAGVQSRSDWSTVNNVGMDLLTVLAHELGHVIGHEHSDEGDLMAATLNTGVRALPVAEHQTTRLPDHQTHSSSQESALWSAFAAEESPLDTPHSDFRIPHSPGSPLSALDSPLRDSLFARLDDAAGERVDGTPDEDDREDRDERPRESEDGLDLWSVLYGLE
jgi:hypothetical protein